MKIEVYYEETSNLGNYESIRVGLKITFEKEDINSPKELDVWKSKCFKMLKTSVKDEITKEKENRNER